MLLTFTDIDKMPISNLKRLALKAYIRNSCVGLKGNEFLKRSDKFIYRYLNYIEAVINEDADFHQKFEQTLVAYTNWGINLCKEDINKEEYNKVYHPFNYNVPHKAPEIPEVACGAGTDGQSRF
jgi:hypothetical protein